MSNGKRNHSALGTRWHIELWHFNPCKFGQRKWQSLCPPFLHRKTSDWVLLSKKLVYSSFSQEGAGGSDADVVVGGARIALRCLGLTTFQPGDEGGEVSDVGVIDACMEGGSGEEAVGVLEKDAEGAVVDGEGMEEDSDRGVSSFELRTTCWASSCCPSLVARVTSMMSAAPWITVP